MDFMAPEVLKVKETKQEYSNKADVWCLGLILVEMLTGKMPNLDMSNEKDKRLP
jgi:serine/threonine protein kinase